MKSSGKMKIVILIVALALAITLVSGCTDEQADTSDETTTEKTAETTTPEDVTLRVLSFRVEDAAFYDEFHPRFEQEYPHIKIEYDVVPTAEWGTIFNARVISGNLDVFAAGDANARDTTMNVHMADLGDQPFFENYFEDALAAGQYEGKQLFLPAAGVGVLTFYNKDLFNDLSISIPQTWDEFIDACEKIKGEGIAPVVLGGADQWPINMVIIEMETGLVSAHDRDFYTKMRTEETKFSDPGWVKIFERIEVLSNYFQRNAFGMPYGQAPGVFALGEAAMMIDGSWSAQQIEDAEPEFEVSAFLLPSSDNKEDNKYIASKYGFGWSVYKETKNMNAALTYLEAFSDRENYSEFVDVIRMLPTIKGVEISSPLVGEIAQLMTNQIPIYEDLLFENVPGATLSWTKYGVLVATGEMSPEDAAAGMQEEFIGSKDAWQ